VCEDTGEKFTTTEQDELKFNELYGQYRVRHGIPFPEEIKATREKYGLSLAAISKILGFGINQYANYENGQVPSESNGKMILAARNKDFMVSLLDSSREQFSETEYTKIRNSILSAPEESASDKLNALFYSDTTCSVYNGFGSLNTNKLANMVKFFSFKEGSVFPTKLNKEMFYADFAHYRKHGRSISGLRYKAIKYGPVPYHYDTIYDNIDGLEKNIVISHNSESTCLSCDGYDAKLFSTDELSTLESVFAITKDLTTEQIVKESHKEPAWTDYKSQNGFIPYSEAFNLVLL
jgi:transcriptional regulator with XRE-family HTH domain